MIAKAEPEVVVEYLAVIFIPMIVFGRLLSQDRRITKIPNPTFFWVRVSEGELGEQCDECHIENNSPTAAAECHGVEHAVKSK